MLNRTCLAVLAVFLAFASVAAADEDQTKTTRGTIIVEVDGEQQQFSFGAKGIQLGAVTEQIKQAIENVEEQKAVGAFFGHGIMIDANGKKTKFKLDDSEEAMKALPGAVRLQIEKATKRARNNQFTAKGFVIGPDGKKTDITFGGNWSGGNVPVEIRKIVEAHVVSGEVIAKPNVIGRAVVISFDGTKHEVSFGTEEGKSDFLKQLPEAVRAHIKNSLKTGRPDTERSDAKLDAILDRLEKLEKDIQELKHANRD